jgi:glucose/arabinose dehydrogenase
VVNSDPDLIGELDMVRLVTGLSNPMFVLPAPGDDERLFIVEKQGFIKILKNGAILPDLFLNIDPVVNSAANERGLLGMAFHPDYQNNRYFFVYYTAASGALTVARYERTVGDPEVADPGSAQIVISVPHPSFSNHNAGMIAFSPNDGKLYVGTGDGGSGCDPGGGLGNAQNLNSLLGKMLRLDVDTLPYDTTGNPFDGPVTGADEIWAYGLRNPWRWSFDRITGAQWIGDVGQNAYEEIDCAAGNSTGGENYGWVLFEGTHGCPPPAPSSCSTACPAIDHALPVRDYNQGGSPCSVIGGYVYRGCRMADLGGTYFYSDYCAPTFTRTFRTDPAGVGAHCSITAAPDTNRRADLDPASQLTRPVSFGEDNQGELYILDQIGGDLFKIVPSLGIVVVSGPGATPLTIGADGSFMWEDVQESTDIPVQEYKIYRSNDRPRGPFSCIESVATGTVWTGGDPAVPAAGAVFYYLITAVGENSESHPGTGSDGNVRQVNSALPCA